MSTRPSPTPPPVSRAAVSSEPATFLVIEFDLELREAGYSVFSAPNEDKARELAEAAVAKNGRLLVDVITPAYLRNWLERARIHPPDLRWVGPAA